MNPILLIAFPLLAGLLAVFLKKINRMLLVAAAVLNVVAAVVISIQYTQPQVIAIGGFDPPFGISLVLDAYALSGILLLNIIFALIILMSFRLTGKLATVLAVALAALNGMILTGDLFNLFVFMEIAAITAYIVTTANKNLKHTFNYLILGSLASGLFLFAIVLIYNIFGSLNMADIKEKIDSISVPVQGALILPLVLLFAGLAVEAKLIPFGGWVKGILSQANQLTGSMIVSAYAFAILLVFGRIFGDLFELSGALLTAFIAIAAATLVLAEAAAFSRKSVREILLFSSIAQSGLVAALFLNHLMLPAVLVLVSNVVSKLVLFTIASQIAETNGTDEVDDLRGVFSRNPLLGISFTVASLSMIGLPLFFGFTVKLNTLVALFDNGNLVLPGIILLMAVVEGSYFIRMLTSLWHAGQEGEIPVKDKRVGYPPVRQTATSITALVIALLIVGSGIMTLIGFGSINAADFMTFIRQSIGGM